MTSSGMRRGLLCVLVAAGAWSLVATSSVLGEGDGLVVSVHVTARGAPAPDARLTLLRDKEAVVPLDETGSARFEGERFGRRRPAWIDDLLVDKTILGVAELRIEKPGFATEWATVPCRGERTEATIDLAPLTSFSAQVLRPDGSPARGLVYVHEHSPLGGRRGRLVARKQLDRQGRVHVDGLGEGRRYYLVVSAGRPYYWLEDDFVAPVASRVYALSLGGTLELDVLDRGGDGLLSNSPVCFVLDERRGDRWTTYLGTDSASSLECLRAGSYRLTVRAPDLGVGVVEPVRVTSGTTTRVKVTLGQGRAVSGRVVRPGGKGVRAFLAYGCNASPLTVTTDEDGRFVVRDLPEHELTLHAWCNDIESTDVEVPAGVGTIPDVVIERSGSRDD